MTTFRVNRDITWTVGGTDLSLPSVLKWTSEDPLAVKVSFGDSTGIVDWVLGRDLLADVVLGRCESAGIGDVHAGRAADGIREYLLLTLSVSRVAQLQAELGEIRFFLEATFQYVPQGEEIEVMDIDAAILRLLDDGQATGV